MTTQLQHVSIPRPPGQASRQLAQAFYTGLLGLEEKPVPTTIQQFDLVWFKIGENTELHLFAEETLPDSSKRHFCLVVENLDSLRQTLESAGYPIFDMGIIRGRPRFFSRDPFNNIIEFTTIQDDYMKYQE